MFIRNLISLFILASVLATFPAYSRVYKNVDVKKFKVSINLKDHKGKSFLNLMKTKIYPALEQEAKNMPKRKHLDAVRNGQGVELKITNDVTTFHVKYKAPFENKAERSGRSFSGVGKKGTKFSYVADASYKHYFSTLDKLVQGNGEEVEDFYEAIVKVIVNCDPSGFSELDRRSKEVAADFIAVYVAEQYRHLISGKGELGRRHNWDDAHLQVTLLAAFHGGQKDSDRGMFFEGKFSKQVYNQMNKISGKKYCVYKQTKLPVRKSFKKRPMQLIDYWQFNKSCDRSGVNITRGDFQKMGRAISTWLKRNDRVLGSSVKKNIGTAGSNVYSSISKFFISNKAPASYGSKTSDIVDSIVDFVMGAHRSAVKITQSID